MDIKVSLPSSASPVMGSIPCPEPKQPIMRSSILTCLLNPRSRVLLQKLTGSQLVKKSPAFYRTWSSLPYSQVPAICPLSWASSTQSIPPHPTSPRSILILSSHLCLGLPSGHYPSGFPSKTQYTPLLSPYAPHAPPISFFSIWSPQQYLLRNTNHKAPHYVVFPVTSSLLGPNILLNTLFSNTLSLRSSLNMSDQVPHPYKTTGKIIVPYILHFIFLNSNLEDKRFCTEW